MKQIFSPTNKMLRQLDDITQILADAKFQVENNTKLRKENRIKSIHSTLALENNSLTLGQMATLMESRKVHGEANEIQAVKNTYDAYQEILTLKPYRQKDFLHAHDLLIKGLANESGQYRHDSAVLAASAAGAKPSLIGAFMTDLFKWGGEDDSAALLKACVFHYEIMAVLPFESGNGVMGRLWQTIILAQWNPIFAWLPLEAIIYEKRQAYDDVLAQAAVQKDAGVFIEFMFTIILETLMVSKTDENYRNKVHLNLTSGENDVFRAVEKYLQNYDFITATIVGKLTGEKTPNARKHLAKFVEVGLLEMRKKNSICLYSFKK